jgi:hypothetical protein
MTTTLLPYRATAPLVAGLAAVAIAGCQSPVPIARADLGYRLVVENGTATVSGLVSAPKALFATSESLFARGADGALRISAEPVAGATVRALDATGRPNAKVLPVRTDAQGRFTLRGLRIGEPAYVQAQFSGADATERSLLAYVRPEGDQACTSVDLASTLVVHKMGRTGMTRSVFDAGKLADLAAAAAAKLPDLLVDAVGDSEGLEAALAGLVKEATTTPPGGGLTGGTGSAIDKVFDQGPLSGGIAGAVDTFLDVNFTIQAFGVNDAPVVHAERARQLLIGPVELVFEAPRAPYEHVSFWLDNRAVADAHHDGQSWVGAWDSRTVADGPYVLSAVVKPAGGGTPTILRAAVYVRNTAPARSAPCAGWTDAGAEAAK